MNDNLAIRRGNDRLGLYANRSIPNLWGFQRHWASAIPVLMSRQAEVRTMTQSRIQTRA
jgi:hypothetical protein